MEAACSHVPPCPQLPTGIHGPAPDRCCPTHYLEAPWSPAVLPRPLRTFLGALLGLLGLVLAISTLTLLEGLAFPDAGTPRPTSAGNWALAILQAAFVAALAGLTLWGAIRLLFERPGPH